MRHITDTIIKAFLEKRAAAKTNTRTDGQCLYLFNNMIAWRDDAGDIFCTMAGWPTSTTRERLNGLAQHLTGKRPFFQYDYMQYFDDRQIGEHEIIKLT